MTKAALLKLLELIPDNAVIFVAGPDAGGYEWTYCNSAEVHIGERGKNWYLEGKDVPRETE